MLQVISLQKWASVSERITLEGAVEICNLVGLREGALAGDMLWGYT